MIRTEKLWVNGEVIRVDELTEMLKEFAARRGIKGKDLQHMGLLTEETMGMASQLLKDFEGEIWLEGTPIGYDIILEADVHSDRRDVVPTANKEGFMAKIAEMLNCSFMFENAQELPEDVAQMLPDYMSYGSKADKQSPVWAGTWCLSAYRDNLEQRRADEEKGIALDELEKSIVAQLADEVMIGIHGRRIRMVISGRVKSL